MRNMTKLFYNLYDIIKTHGINISIGMNINMNFSRLTRTYSTAKSCVMIIFRFQVFKITNNVYLHVRHFLKILNFFMKNC
jgi:hypothetical protein